jgi:hypothetical protein
MTGLLFMYVSVDYLHYRFSDLLGEHTELDTDNLGRILVMVS